LESFGALFILRIRGGEIVAEIDVAKYFLTQGPWAVLFVWLLIYVMRNNKEREGRLHDILEKFSEKYDVVIDELRDIKNKIGGDK
jgi:hypothetical protein